MTGFASVRKASEACEVALNVKSLNHRGLELHFSMPPELNVLESELRALIKQRASRGHFQIYISYTSSRRVSAVLVNRALLESYVAAFRQAVAEFGLSGEPDLNMALTLPGIFRDQAPEAPDEDLRRLVLEAMSEGLDELSSFRQREGAAIAEEIRSRTARIQELNARLEQLRNQALPTFQARLRNRLEELLMGSFVEPQRIIQEAALLAERSDISEETARLKIHAAQLEQLLRQGGEVGKKLDFLLQEMNREANTILGKTTGIGELGLAITELALAAKAEIDKIREQSLNLE
jgi:uncharacterized protein (TIGR00255 family)